ncbi:MAG: endolytic transglycosylase MltG [Novosphingobium sp.]
MARTSRAALSRRRKLAAVLVVAVVLAAVATWFLGGWYRGGPLQQDRAFIVPPGAGLVVVAAKLEREGAIASADSFLLRARLLGSSKGIRAGEFRLPKHASPAQVLATLQSNGVIRRLVAVPEGMPSVLVWERLNAEPLLTGTIPVPAEGSVLPDSYAFARGESRAAVLARMQKAMTKTLSELWKKRAAGLAVKTPGEAVTLASIVEKETGKSAERRTVAGLYSNRLRQGMPLQADPTIIYPITRGKPLGRRILRSEIDATNDYNTYAMTGLPKGPITNPGRASLAAVLDPAKTQALYMVADGTGGHAFAATLAEHDANVVRWRAIRRARGEL